MATAIVRRKVLLEDFTETAIESKDILHLTKKMSIKIDSTLNRPDKIEPTRVKLTTKQGEVYSKEVENPLGSLERPMSFDDCARKFKDCAKQLSPEQINGVIELVGKLDRVRDIREIISLLSLE